MFKNCLLEILSRFIYTATNNFLCKELACGYSVFVCAGHKSNVPYGSCVSPKIGLHDFQELFKNPSAVQAVELAGMLHQCHILILAQ